MKKVYLMLLFILFMNLEMRAQANDPTGTYYLRGVMEMASGFKLNPDSTFDFFYTYGAVDRFGSGTWELKGEQIILNSKTKHEKDFKLVTSAARSNKDITIRFSDANENILPYLHVALKRGEAFEDKKTDHDGLVHFEKKAFDSIVLMLSLFPDKKASFAPVSSTHNYYEFNLEPWISEVVFDHQVYLITKEGLKGKHPLLDEKEYDFERPE
jgi:hypothetical protein